jgi:nucleoside-diphosphate-sugar epimerase
METMKVIIIGGSGHIGTYLTPRLVETGHTVVNVSRGKRPPYQQHGAWKCVEQVVVDRKLAEATNSFGEIIASLEPEIVIDITCYTLASCVELVEAVRDKVLHFLHCGTIWVHGHSTEVPTTESQPRRPFGEYGIQKAAIEQYLIRESRLQGFPATVIHPGHLVGPGWTPLNPAGNFDAGVFAALAQGREIALPNLGRETLHHVHADDVAQCFTAAIANWCNAVGESFHAVSPAAITLLGYAEWVAQWFGQDLKVRFLPWEEWRQTVTPSDAAKTWDHIAHSPNCSIEKARRLLGYAPRYRSMEAVREALAAMNLLG